MFGKKETKQLTWRDLVVFESDNLLALGLGDVDYSYKELFTIIDSLLNQLMQSKEIDYTIILIDHLLIYYFENRNLFPKLHFVPKDLSMKLQRV